MKTAAMIFAILTLACCVTVNVYFPAPAVQAAADRIVQEVRPEEQRPAAPAGEPAPAEPGPQSGLTGIVMAARPHGPQGTWPASATLQRAVTRPWWLTTLAWLSPRAAHAAEVDINVSTPAIRQLKADIKGRYGQLAPFYGQGAVGETNRGYLELKEAGSLDLRQRAELNRLVAAENADRKRLYEEIIKANNFGMEFLPQVEKLFANSWRKEAAPGTFIQEDNGNWRRK